MVSASCLDEWAEMGLPKFMAVQTSDFNERLVAAADVAAIPRMVCSGFPIKLLNTLSASASRRWWLRVSRGLPGEVAVPNGDATEQWRAPYVTSLMRLSIGAVLAARTLARRARVHVGCSRCRA